MKKTILLILVSLLFTTNVYAISNPYSKTSSYGTNCTWYAWKMAKEKGGVTLPGWGNAKDWYKDAKNDGYSVGSTPKAKSIVVWGNWTSKGHVGYVEKVSGDTIYVWDSTGPCIDEEDEEYIECMANGVSEESDKACRAAAPKVACKYSVSVPNYKITGFIYLTDLPKATQKVTTTTTTKKKTTINTTTSTTTKTTKEESTSKTTINTTELEEKVTTTRKPQKKAKVINKKVLAIIAVIFLSMICLIIYVRIRKNR